MNISEKGIKLIKLWEGKPSTNGKPALKPYLCQAGKPTIGWGTTVYPTSKKVSLLDGEITIEQAENFLMHDIEKYEKTVNKEVKIDINQNQYDALVSLCYNIGRSNFKGSTLLMYINLSDFNNASNEFDKWIYYTNPDTGKKEISNGLINRRKAEKKLFDKPVKTNLKKTRVFDIIKRALKSFISTLKKG